MTDINTTLLVPPNWEHKVSIIELFRTSIQKSITGHEKRMGIFSWYRLGTRFSIDSLSWEEMARVRRRFMRFQTGIVGIPLWTDLDVLAAQAAAAQADVEITAVENTWFKVGRKVCIWDPTDLDDYETGEISAVDYDNATITLSANLDSTWDAGSHIAPILAARLGNANSFRWMTDTYNNVAIEAREGFE